MKYVALLRGINVGGNSMIKMADLKVCFEGLGFQNVKTYINSGNVIFETEEKDAESLTKEIESALLKVFKIPLKIVLQSQNQLQKVVETVPSSWKKKEDIRRYVVFVKEPTTPDDVFSQVEIHEGIDFAEKGPGVLYLSTLLEGITKSKMSKLITKKIYQEVTMRNYNTTQKILALMEQS